MEYLIQILPLLVQNTDQKRMPSDQDQNSMLKVICNQRDRFRARLRETEEVSHSNFLIFVFTILAFCLYFSFSWNISIKLSSTFLEENILLWFVIILKIVGGKATEGEDKDLNSRAGEDKSW